MLRRANPCEDEIALLRRAGGCPEFPGLRDLSATRLKVLSDKSGVDFATALLYDRFQKSTSHGDFIRQIDSVRREAAPPTKLADTKVVIVPGALYVERPDLGGDGRLVREVAERFGYQTELIALKSFGAVTTNARLICEWMQRQSPQRVILVSLSKGGADLKLALELSGRADCFRSVVAWVNVCGPLNGTRMANWILDSRLRSWAFRAKCRWQKRDFGLVEELRCARDAPLANAVQLPATLRMLSMVGFPLRLHMTTRHSRFCHRRLATWGPNDGTISLGDLIEWPGMIYPVWGADHYLRPEGRARELISALLCWLSQT